MSNGGPRVTIRLTRNRLLLALWVALAAATWMILANEVSRIERPTIVSYEVSVWRDAGGGSWTPVAGFDSMLRDGAGGPAYPFLQRNGDRLNTCTPANGTVTGCGIVTVGSEQITLQFAGRETRTRPSTEVVAQPTYGLADLLARSAFTATFLTLAAGVLWVAVARIRRNVRVAR